MVMRVKARALSSPPVRERWEVGERGVRCRDLMLDWWME